MLLERIRRVTRDGRWIPEIDGLRFLAITAVVMAHLSGELDVRMSKPIVTEPRYYWLHRAFDHGDRGVGLFFVISGMVLAMPFARHYLMGARPVSLRKYYLRRLTRLEPPYLLSLVAFTLFMFLGLHGLPPGYIKEVFANAFYVHDQIYGHMGVSPVLWSLEVEIQFYLLAPLMMMAFLIPGKMLRRVLLLLALLVIGLLQLQIGWMHSARGNLSLAFYLQYFLAGVFIADVFVLDLPRMKSGWWWDGAGLLAFAVMLWGAPPGPMHVALPYLCIVLIFGALRSVVFRRIMSNGWIAAFGGMCYSIYLMHFAIIAAVFRYSRRLVLPQFDYAANFALQFVLVGVPIALWSIGYFVLVERPCMDPDWPGKLWARVTGRSMHDLDALDTAGVTEGSGSPGR